MSMNNLFRIHVKDTLFKKSIIHFFSFLVQVWGDLYHPPDSQGKTVVFIGMNIAQP